MQLEATFRRSTKLTGIVKRIPGSLYAVVIMFVFLSFTARGFFTYYNLSNLLGQMSMLLIISLGMTLIILSEGIDLSQGAVMCLAGVVMAMLVHYGINPILAGFMTLIVGFTFGLLTGSLISIIKLPPFVASFGTMGIAQGLALVITAGSSVNNESEALQRMVNNTILFIPVPFWIATLLFFVVYGLLYHTKFGSYVFAIGGNEEAARLSGVSVNFYKTMIYVLGGVLAALAALIMVGRLNSGHPTVALGMEFDAIAAVLLGGTSFSKGNGGLPGTILGVLIIVFLKNGLNLLGIDPFVQLPLIGIIIIIGITFQKN